MDNTFIHSYKKYSYKSYKKKNTEHLYDDAFKRVRITLVKKQITYASDSHIVQQIQKWSPKSLSLNSISSSKIFHIFCFWIKVLLFLAIICRFLLPPFNHFFKKRIHKTFKTWNTTHNITSVWNFQSNWIFKTFFKMHKKNLALSLWENDQTYHILFNDFSEIRIRFLEW